MLEIIEKLHGMVWGLPTVILILAVGIYLSIKSRFFQIRCFPHAFRSFLSAFQKNDQRGNDVSPYQALCTALAATVGTGNIVGVAGAISIGGPGAIFWMLVCAFFGMVIKCCEAVLSVRYRKKLSDGEIHGGPMYIIEYGMGAKWKWLAVLYAVFGVVAAFGVGNATQINAVISSIHSTFMAFEINVSFHIDLLIATGLAGLIACLQLGGAKRIGKITESLVPVASLVYILLGMGILIVRAKYIPAALSAIMLGVTSPEAVTGGAVGSIFLVCRTGASRGVFTNEAGMGTASIAHASANVKHPVEQGMMGMMEVFLDTVVICTVTALVILCSGVSVPYGTDTGASLTIKAFSLLYGNWASVLLSFCLILFAVATVVGWGLYGLRCAQYLFGPSVKNVFIILQIITVIVCSLLNTGTIWMLADCMNALMSIPNLLALLILSPEFIQLLKEYRKGLILPIGGTNENINQCEPLRTVTNEKVSPLGGKSTKGRKTNISSEYWPA